MDSSKFSSLLLLISLSFAVALPAVHCSVPSSPDWRPFLAPILSSLGFTELAMAVPSLSFAGLPRAWSGPITLFAPSDDTIRSCSSCSPARLLHEHLVPGLFSFGYLSLLPHASKIETAYPGRCLTVTSTSRGSARSNSSEVKIFVNGVAITRPDLFNDGRVVIHGLDGFIAPLSPLSCNQDVSSIPSTATTIAAADRAGSAIARLMIRDAIVRLRDGGYSILALAMRIKYPELVGLQNMTVFALDDSAIFAGGHSYVTNVRFHIIPDRLLMYSDLLHLPSGTVLPTLVHGQHLVVTHAGTADTAAHGPAATGLRINYIPVKSPDVVYNTKIVVHGVFLPFPHLYLADLAIEAKSPALMDSIFEAPPAGARMETCAVPGGCLGAPNAAPAPPMIVEFDDDGL